MFKYAPMVSILFGTWASYATTLPSYYHARVILASLETGN